MTPQTISLRRLFLAALALLVGLAVVLLTGPVGPAAADDRDDLPTWRGWIESQPIGTNLGTWVVGGRAFQADSHTEFDQEEGPLVVGACAKVKYQTVNGVDRAVEIDSEPPADCGGATATPTVPPSASATPTRTATPGGQDVSVKARVDSMPAGGLIGVWVIGGVSYTTDANTVFRQDHGPFRVGACVEVEYHTSHPSYARKIATKSDDNCPPSGGATATPTPTRTVTPDATATPTRTVTPTATPTPDDRGGTGRRELYGVIESFPAGLIGLWQIGGMTFVADAGTRFEQERAAFAVGVLVEVHFTTDAAGVNRALKIESTAAGSGAPIGVEGHAFGTVEAMPTGSLVGTWRIGGMDYSATTATRFKQNHGPLAIGAWVKVDYVQAADGTRTARKIETTSTASNPAQPEHAKAYGFVQQKPPTGFLGTWVINGIAYIADASTRFDETRGLLALGAYVEVEYIPGASNRIIKLETHVPPGAGPDDRAGVIQQMDASSRLSAISAVWVIEGVSYQVLPATVLDDSLGPLAVGSMAAVNSYVDGNGNRVATQIRGVTFTRRLYLPMLSQRR